MATTIQGALTELGQQFVDSLRQELDSKRISASGNRISCCKETSI